MLCQRNRKRRQELPCSEKMGLLWTRVQPCGNGQSSPPPLFVFFFVAHPPKGGMVRFCFRDFYFQEEAESEWNGCEVGRVFGKKKNSIKSKRKKGMAIFFLRNKNGERVLIETVNIHFDHGWELMARRGKTFREVRDTVPSRRKWRQLRWQRWEVKDLRLFDPRVDPIGVALSTKKNLRRAWWAPCAAEAMNPARRCADLPASCPTRSKK